MMAVWENFSPRERLMVGGLGAFLGVVVLIFLIVRPIADYRQNATIAYEDATATWLAVSRAATAENQQTQRADSGGSLRALITRSASQEGILIRNINISSDRVDLNLETGTTAQVYAWFNLLEEAHKVRVVDAVLRPSFDGDGLTVRVTVVQDQ